MALPVPVRFAVPEVVRPAYAYALAELLRGLGLVPVEARAEAPRVVVGGARAGGALHLPAAPERLAQLIDTRAAHAADAGGWLDGDVHVPLPLAASDGVADLLGSAFLWLVRYAEHARGAPRDRHGRATYAGSWQATHGLALVPVVDILRGVLAGRLASHPATAALPQRPPTYGGMGADGAAWALCPTCDVDALRKWRPGIVRREAVRAARERSPRRVVAAAAGWLRSHLARRDPLLDGLDLVAEAAEHAGGTATFFVKADAPTPFDTPYRLSDARLRRFLARAASHGHEIALHPSYASHDRIEALIVERARLERASGPLTGTAVTAVRQHYLRYDLTATARLHEEAGFTLDSTLGWAEHEGFRCGTTHPHRLFDLSARRPLDVWELPLALMDATFVGYRLLSTAEIRVATHEILNAARRYGGVVVGLWHNTAGDEDDAPGAAAHMEATLRAATGQGARIAGVSDVLAAYLEG